MSLNFILRHLADLLLQPIKIRGDTNGVFVRCSVFLQVLYFDLLLVAGRYCWRREMEIIVVDYIYATLVYRVCVQHSLQMRKANA